MPKLTEEQMARGRERFLDGYPDIKRRIQSLTAAEADAMCTTLEKLRAIETMKAVSQVARALGKDSQELFFSCVADTAEEFAMLVAASRQEIKAILDGDQG